MFTIRMNTYFRVDVGTLSYMGFVTCYLIV